MKEILLERDPPGTGVGERGAAKLSWPGGMVREAGWRTEPAIIVWKRVPEVEVVGILKVQILTSPYTKCMFSERPKGAMALRWLSE